MTESAPPTLHSPVLNLNTHLFCNHHHPNSISRSLASSSPIHSSPSASSHSPLSLKNAPIRRPLSATLVSHSAKSTSSSTAHAEFLQSSVYCSSNRHSLPVQHSAQPRLRQLILPMLRTATTTTVRSYSPGSPPDLTDSKSSKSSSFPSSGRPDDAPADLSHFEDISLDDVAAGFSPWSDKFVPGGQIRSHPQPTLYRHSTAKTGSLRDLTNASRSLSGGRPQSAGTSARNRFQLPVPGPRSARPRVKQLLTNGNHMLVDKQNHSLSAAAMPGSRNFSPSPMSAGASSSSGRTRFSSASIHVRRRQSWQPGRKTVKELEDEYHDSDEDVPDDAFIWNVPISPRPPHERDLRRTVTEPSPLSPDLPPSMQRRPGQHNSSANSPSLDRADTNMSTASAPPALNIDDIKRPLTPHSPGLSDTSSAEFPGSMHLASRRDAALSALSQDARHLTEALEMFAEKTERQQEELIQTGKTKSSSMPTSPTRNDLPPIRRNDPLIDPLPVSTEKEKFLTRTRPSWLPPKSKKEERRHLKEFQRMMAHVAEAEKKRARTQHKTRCERDDAALERTKTWDTHVLPNWRTAIREPKTRDLWWRGIPPQRRGDVWSRAIGNGLGLNTASYEAALKRAQDVDARLASMTEEDRERDPLGDIFAKLKVNASSTYPELNIFQPDGPLHESLLDVCKAYVLYRVDANPSALASLPSLVALLLINLPAAPAFITLANALHRPVPSALLASPSSPSDPATLHTSYNLILTTLQHTLPSLHTHLLSLSHRSSATSTTSSKASSDLSSSDSLPQTSPLQQPSWTQPMVELLQPLLHALVFASPRLGLDISSRVWDVVAFESDAGLVRAAVAVLERLEGRLYGGHWDEACRELGAAGAAGVGEEPYGCWDEKLEHETATDTAAAAAAATTEMWPLGEPDEFLRRMASLEV